MKKMLALCKIADPDARARIARCYELEEREGVTEPELLTLIPGYEALMVPFTSQILVSERVVDAASKLELIASTYGGTRQNIADVYAIGKGITVIHTGASRERPMAEYTLGLVLSSLLKIASYNHDMRGSEPWPRFKYPRTRILSGRSVAIVGYGRIGRAIAKLFSAFTDQIAAVSKHLTPEAAAKDGVAIVSKEEAFAKSDIIILAGGNTQETRHLVGAREFSLMRDGSLFVNIARGAMVDEKAMAEAAKDGRIQLALDVFETEPLPDDSPLRKLDNAVLTPHRANNSLEFEERWQCLAADIELLAQGKIPDSALTVERARVMSES